MCDGPPASEHLDGTAWRLEPNEADLCGISIAFHPGRLVVTLHGRPKTVLRYGAGR